ncbi:MAG: hypothetical protein KDD37_00510 [Bdellovibrionales bacterium]|nr:hypothetical protein [Bdellovibrionales bacterium]
MFQILFAFTVFASVPNKITTIDGDLGYLRKPEAIRVSYFKNKVNFLEKVIFSDAQTFQYRWMAFATLTKVKPDKKVFEKALRSNEWFLRDVALKASVSLFPKESLGWNRAAIDDVALVVRTTAIKNLKKLQDTASIDALWDELYAKRNFRKQQGLWIRKHILDAIVSFLPSVETHKKLWESRLLQIVKTEDETLQPYAFSFLKQNYPSGPSFVNDEPISIQRKKWMAFLNVKN